MNNLVEHAKKELDILGMPEDAEDIDREMRKCILDIIELFSTQGHSGTSAAYCTDVAVKLLRWENLSPITNDPDDWMEVGDDLWQSLRNPRFFSNDEGANYYDVEDKTTKCKSEEYSI